MARTVKKNLQDGIELAKSRWSNHLAERIHSMSHFPKDTWSAVNKLKDQIQGYHVTPNIMRFKKEDETYTETDEEYLEMLSTHFEKVFNSDINIDWSMLSEIKQKPILNFIDTKLQYNEFSFVINKLTLHRAAGENGISPNAIKALDKEN